MHFINLIPPEPRYLQSSLFRRYLNYSSLEHLDHVVDFLLEGLLKSISTMRAILDVVLLLFVIMISDIKRAEKGQKAKEVLRPTMAGSRPQDRSGAIYCIFTRILPYKPILSVVKVKISRMDGLQASMHL